MADKTFDLAILGAGVFGLQLARQALLHGLSVCVFEAREIGSGASGGLLGALMPHIPDRWNEKKQFQFEALMALEDECANLTSDTGLPTGYGRIGRLMPLREERFLPIAAERAKGAETYWAIWRYSFKRTDEAADWIDPEIARFGAVLDTLGGRLYPTLYLKALSSFVRNNSRGALVEGVALGEDHFKSKRVDTGEGFFAFEKIAICAGFRSFPRVEALTAQDVGGGVKGQARMVKLAMPEGTPVIYDDGCYIVPHDNGTVAVGSTSVKAWDNEKNPDPENWGFFDKAKALCPVLRGAPIMREWAGVRPKAHLREPIVGALPGFVDVYLFTGGFKISFGIAHYAAKALVQEITGKPSQIALPRTFLPEHHFK